MDTTTANVRAHEVTAPGSGSHHHFLNHLATVKVDPGATASGLGAVEFTAPRGFGPPLHLHREEDELFYVVEGRIRFRHGATEVVGETGTLLVLPVGEAHTFQVESDSARFLTVVAGHQAEPSFVDLVSRLGAPMPQARMPEPVEIDPGAVAAACAEHGVEVLGPPPAPLR